MRHRASRCCAAVVMFALLGSNSRVALGADSNPLVVTDQQATARFQTALARFDAQEFAEALPLFQQAWQLTRSPNARFYVARCLIELGRHTEAYAELNGVIADATAANDPRYVPTRSAAQTELATLEPRISTLSITLPEPTSGLIVTLDGSPLGLAQLREPLVLEPGVHQLKAQATGMQPQDLTLELKAGRAQSVPLRFTPARTESPKPAAPSPPKATGLGTVRAAGLVTGGVGVAALGVFAVTGVMAKSKYDSVQGACGGTRCVGDSYGAEIDQGKSLQTIANVSIVFAGLAIATGGALFAFGPRPSADPQLGATVLPGGGYASYRGRF
jgi:hypothetical protein